MSDTRARSTTFLVADDHAGTRKSLAALLRNNRMRVVGEAANGEEAVLLCEQLHPDVAVLDISMPLLNGFEAGRQIAKLSPNTKLIFLSSDAAEEFVREGFRVGGIAFVSKAHAKNDLLKAIEAALQGKTYVSGESAT